MPINPHYFSLSFNLTRSQQIQLGAIKLEIERAVSANEYEPSATLCQIYLDNESDVESGTARLRGALLPHDVAFRIKAVLDEYAIKLINEREHDPQLQVVS